MFQIYSVLKHALLYSIKIKSKNKKLIKLKQYLVRIYKSNVITKFKFKNKNYQQSSVPLVINSNLNIKQIDKMNRIKQNSLTNRILGRSISRSRSPPINKSSKSKDKQQRFHTSKFNPQKQFSSYPTKHLNNNNFSQKHGYNNNIIHLAQNQFQVPDQKDIFSNRLFKQQSLHLPLPCLQQMKINELSTGEKYHPCKRIYDQLELDRQNINTLFKMQQQPRKQLKKQHNNYHHQRQQVQKYYDNCNQKQLTEQQYFYHNDQQFQFKDVDLGVPYVQSKHLDSGYQYDYQNQQILSFNNNDNSLMMMKMQFVSSGKEIFTSILDIQTQQFQNNNTQQQLLIYNQNLNNNRNINASIQSNSNKNRKKSINTPQLQLQQQNFTDQEENSEDFSLEQTKHKFGTRSRKKTVTINDKQQNQQIRRKNSSILSKQAIQYSINPTDKNVIKKHQFFFSTNLTSNRQNPSNLPCQLIQNLKLKTKNRHQKLKFWNSQLHQLQKSNYTLKNNLNQSSLQSLQAQFLTCMKSVTLKNNVNDNNCNKIQDFQCKDDKKLNYYQKEFNFYNYIDQEKYKIKKRTSQIKRSKIQKQPLKSRQKIITLNNHKSKSIDNALKDKNLNKSNSKTKFNFQIITKPIKQTQNKQPSLFYETYSQKHPISPKQKFIQHIIKQPKQSSLSPPTSKHNKISSIIAFVNYNNHDQQNKQNMICEVNNNISNVQNTNKKGVMDGLSKKNFIKCQKQKIFVTKRVV